MTIESLAADIVSRIPAMQQDTPTNNEALVARLIRDYHAENIRACQKEIEAHREEMRKLDKEMEDAWYNRVYKYPLFGWRCPKCQKRLTKGSLFWNHMLSENVCHNCGNPQRQFAIPSVRLKKYVKDSEPCG